MNKYRLSLFEVKSSPLQPAKVLNLEKSNELIHCLREYAATSNCMCCPNYNDIKEEAAMLECNEFGTEAAKPYYLTKANIHLPAV